MNRRLEDRIRELCALAVSTSRDAEREFILAELQVALREHAERLKKTAVQKLVTKDESALTEKRVMIDNSP